MASFKWNLVDTLRKSHVFLQLYKSILSKYVLLAPTTKLRKLYSPESEENQEIIKTQNSQGECPRCWKMSIYGNSRNQEAKGEKKINQELNKIIH